MSSLTPLQIEVARLFFSLPASDGFLLAGGGALLANGLSMRPTRDLDFFGVASSADIHAACHQLVSALNQRGAAAVIVTDTPTFARIELVSSEGLIVDLCADLGPLRSPTMSLVGPTFHPEDLAGRTLLALYSRAEARDFIDLLQLAEHFPLEVIVARAAELDLGLDPTVLAEMMASIDRLSDEELSIGGHHADTVRQYFRHWAGTLRSGGA